MKIGMFEFDLERYPVCLQLEYAISKLEEGHKVVWLRPKQSAWLNLDFPFTRKLNRTFDANNLHFALQQILKKFRNFELIDFEAPSLKASHLIQSDSTLRAWQEVSVRLRDSIPCSSHYQSLANKLSLTYSKLYFQSLAILSEQKFDQIALFNGRFLCHNAVWKAAERLNLPVVFLERFNLDWRNRYFVFEEPVHSSKFRATVMRSFYQNYPSSPISKITEANLWFENRILHNGSQFTANQSQMFTRDKETNTVISFFHSSEDELFTIGLKPVSWKNQFEAITSIIRYVSSRSGVQLVVRLHPNLKYKSSREQRRWKRFAKNMRSDRVTFILPEASVKTYSLLMQSDKVLTFGSTVGVEASWLKIPSGLMSSALHRDLKVCEQIGSEIELFDFLDGKWNYQVSQSDLFAYALFQIHGGQTFTNLEISSSDDNLQDPIYSYEGRFIGNSKLVSASKRIEGFFTKLLRRFRDFFCSLDHSPYIHHHVAG